MCLDPRREPLGYVATFQQSDDRRRGKPLAQPMGQIGVMLRLQGEAAQRIAGHGIESGRYQHQVGESTRSWR